MIHGTYTPIVELLNRNLRNKVKVRILDFGCGEGSIIGYLPDEIIERYVGVDRNVNSIILAKKRFHNKKYSFYKANEVEIKKMFKRGYFDVVLLVGVLQYVSDKKIIKMFKNFNYLLKENGLIIGVTSNDFFIYKIFDFYSFFVKHNFFKVIYLKKIFEKCGFKIISVIKRGILISPFFSNFFVIFFDFLDKFLWNKKGGLGILGQLCRNLYSPFLIFEFYLPLDFGYHIYFVLRKRS